MEVLSVCRYTRDCERIYSIDKEKINIQKAFKYSWKSVRKIDNPVNRQQRLKSNSQIQEKANVACTHTERFPGCQLEEIL